MALQPISRLDKFTAAGYQCSLTHRHHGRCAGLRLEEHHLESLGRSGKRRGSKDEGPTCLVCALDHRRIEHQTTPEEIAQGITWLWRATMPNGTYAFVDDYGARAAPGERIEAVIAGTDEPDFYLWPNLDDQNQSQLAEREFDAAYDQAKSAHWRMALAILYLEEGNRWHLIGYDTLEQFAAEKGLTVRAGKEMLEAARNRARYLTPHQQDRVLDHGLRLMRDAGPSIRKLHARIGNAPAADKDAARQMVIFAVDEIIDAAEVTGRTREGIERARELARPRDTKWRQINVQGALLLGIDADLEIDERGRTSEGLTAIEHVRTRLRQHAYVAGTEESIVKDITCSDCGGALTITAEKLHVAGAEQE